MSVEALWPYAHVADVQASIAFYERLGLRVHNTHEDGGRLVWAFMLDDSERAGIMLAVTDQPADRTLQGVLFYCWCSDLRALRDELGTGEITHPFYMPAGELRLEDPDGYVVLVGQLG